MDPLSTPQRGSRPVNTSLLDIQDMECHAHSHGEYSIDWYNYDLTTTTSYKPSAEAVTGLILADLKGEAWTVPEWFPRHYLTTDSLRSIGKRTD